MMNRPRLIGCIALLVLIGPASAFADGMFVWRNQKVDIQEPEQKAAIFWDGNHEDLVLSVKFDGAPKEFGWIVPLPAVPELSPDDPLLFEQLSQATQERPTYRLSRLSGVHMTAGMKSVEVLKTERVGLYDTTILKATDGASLKEWLRRHRFKLPRRASTVLDRYVEQDWVFVAMKIASDAPRASTKKSLRSGTIHPIRFRFRTNQPVYPLEISSLLSKDSDVLLYVISKEPLVPPDLPRVRWERLVSASPSTLQRAFSYYFLENPHRDRSCVDGYCVTKSRALFSPDAMRDLVFAPFDFERALTSDFTMERLDAVGVIAHRRPVNAEELLLSVIRPDRTNLEKIAALWGLAQLGVIHDPRAVQDLIDDPDPDIQLQALEALAICRSPSVLGSALRFLKSTELSPPPRPRFRSFADDDVLRASIEILIAQGDRTCIKPLRELADQNAAYDQLKMLGQPHREVSRRDALRQLPGMGLLIALAACGEQPAQEAIEKSLAEDLQEEETPGYPVARDADSWICRAILYESESLQGWRVFSTLNPLIALRPEVSDAIYRRIVYTHDSQDLAKILLLSRLSILDKRDTQTLHWIWRKKEHSCAAAFALAKQGNDRALRSLWGETLKDSPDRTEVVHAMALSGDSTLAAPVLEYVRDVWDRTFRSNDWRSQAAEDMKSQRGPASQVFHSGPPDLDSRTRSIARFLTGLVSTDVALRPLTSDRSLDPIHRLFWIEICDFTRISQENLWLERTEILRDIERDSRHDPLASAIAKDMLAHHERLVATFAAQEEERAARAAGIPIAYERSVSSDGFRR